MLNPPCELGPSQELQWQRASGCESTTFPSLWLRVAFAPSVTSNVVASGRPSPPTLLKKSRSSTTSRLVFTAIPPRLTSFHEIRLIPYPLLPFHEGWQAITRITHQGLPGLPSPLPGCRSAVSFPDAPVCSPRVIIPVHPVCTRQEGCERLSRLPAGLQFQ